MPLQKSPRKKSSKKVPRSNPKPEPPESPSDRARREQDEAEDKGLVSPALTVEDDGTMVQKTSTERKKDAAKRINNLYDELSTS